MTELTSHWAVRRGHRPGCAALRWLRPMRPADWRRLGAGELGRRGGRCGGLGGLGGPADCSDCAVARRARDTHSEGRANVDPRRGQEHSRALIGLTGAGANEEGCRVGY